MSLGELLRDAATDLKGTVAATDPDGATTWARGGHVFALVSGDGAVASFLLDPAVAAAAVRTPDTASSPRGPGWVDFAPAELDDRAADRAVAWLGSAYRRVAPRD